MSLPLCPRCNEREWISAKRRWCAPCASAYHKEYRAKNAEKLKQRSQRYYEENRERVKANASKWGRANRERRREIVRASYWRNVDENRIRSIEYQARRRAAGGNIDKDCEYVAILRNDPCCYCGEPMGHIDHIVPVKAGGTSEWDNLTAACATCNYKKNAKPLLHFMLEQTSP